MGKVELTQPIAASPRHVFAFFVPQRMPYWYGAEMESCFEVQDGAADLSLGLKVRISGHLGRRTVSHTAVITAFEEARLLEWRFQDEYGVRGLERWELETLPGPAPDSTPGGTLVRFTSQYEMSGRIGRVLDWLLTRRAVERRSRKYLERLARLAEHGAEPARLRSAAK
jgi:Polyketide cyclase / dehydrase and lipid transport